MKTKLDYYRIFFETARFASFSTAAQHLYISQSAISQCIRQLEKDLNAQLFIRTRKGVALTKEGQLLFKKVESAIMSIEQGETLLEQLQHLERGELTIAAGDTITTHYLLPYLEKFHKLYPHIRIEMANSYSARMVQLVKEGHADLAFVNLPINDDDLCIKHCMEIHDIFVCGAEHPCKDSYSRQEIASQPLILLEKKSSSRRFLDKTFQNDGITLDPQIETASYDLLLRFAAIHLGVTCVVEEYSKESLDSGVIRKMSLDVPLPPRSIGCVYRSEESLTLASKAFMKLVSP